MLPKNIMEPEQTERAAPMVFDPNKDRTLQFCVGYQKHNAITKRASYPIPRKDECINSLCKAAVRSTLDAYSGYWQTETEDKDMGKTAFSLHHKLYQVVAMPFGLCNAHGTFQRTMDVSLFSVKRQSALVYLDEIVTLSKTPKQHIEHTQEVLPLLNSAEATLILKKCSFFTYTIDFSGQIVRPRRLELAFHTTDAIRGLKPPTSMTKLISFLGMCSNFLRIVSSFARIVSPLSQRL